MTVKKKKLLIASVLKPVDDTRMYEKFALSLAQTNKYEVNIIGFSGNSQPAHPNIRFLPLFSFVRNSPKRLLASFFYAKKVLQLKPELTIVTCSELLGVSWLIRRIFGLKYCYDMQENTWRNILWSADKPTLLRKALASLVWLNDRSFLPSTEQVFIAERCYKNEWSFSKGQVVYVLENKARKPALLLLDAAFSKGVNQSIKLCFTGTILESYGIQDAIALVDHLIKQGQNICLHVAGHCPRKALYDWLFEQQKSRSWLKLQISTSPVSHQNLLKVLAEADYAVIAYKLNPSNEGCFPTRIYEALAYRKPMLFKKGHPWTTLIDKYDCGLAVDFDSPKVDLQPRLKTGFYRYELPENIFWEYEEKRLLSAVEEQLG